MTNSDVVSLLRRNMVRLNRFYLINIEMVRKRYMNPYLAGTLLGIVLLLAMIVSGRGLGASGGFKYCVVSVVNAVSPSHIENSAHYSKYFEDGKKPITNWLALS